MNNNVRRTPQGELRAESQRQRILLAAKACFVQDGLHAGTIARISAVAQMSPGLIYRYFASKEDIVLALLERQISTGNGADLAGVSPETLVQRICEYFRRWLAGDSDVPSATLILEMSAESTRSKVIARQIGTVDAEARASLSSWLKEVTSKSGVPLGSEESKVRTFALECFIDGLVLRAVREPNVDMKMIEDSLNYFIACILRSNGEPLPVPTAAPCAL